MKTVRENPEEQLQSCIDNLQEEVLDALFQSQESLIENIDIIQHNIENYDERAQKAQIDISSLSQQNQNMELKFKAKFDVQSAQAEQQIDRKLQKDKQANIQKLEDLKLSQGIEATQQKFQAIDTEVNERLTQIENQDKIEILQPILKQIPQFDLAVYINQTNTFHNEVKDLNINDYILKQENNQLIINIKALIKEFRLTITKFRNQYNILYQQQQANQSIRSKEENKKAKNIPKNEVKQDSKKVKQIQNNENEPNEKNYTVFNCEEINGLSINQYIVQQLQKLNDESKMIRADNNNVEIGSENFPVSNKVDQKDNQNKNKTILQKRPSNKQEQNEQSNKIQKLSENNSNKKEQKIINNQVIDSNQQEIVAQSNEIQTYPEEFYELNKREIKQFEKLEKKFGNHQDWLNFMKLFLLYNNSIISLAEFWVIVKDQYPHRIFIKLTTEWGLLSSKDDEIKENSLFLIDIDIETDQTKQIPNTNYYQIENNIIKPCCAAKDNPINNGFYQQFINDDYIFLEPNSQDDIKLKQHSYIFNQFMEAENKMYQLDQQIEMIEKFYNIINRQIQEENQQINKDIFKKHHFNFTINYFERIQRKKIVDCLTKSFNLEKINEIKQLIHTKLYKLRIKKQQELPNLKEILIQTKMEEYKNQVTQYFDDEEFKQTIFSYQGIDSYDEDKIKQNNKHYLQKHNIEIENNIDDEDPFATYFGKISCCIEENIIRDPRIKQYISHSTDNCKCDCKDNCKNPSRCPCYKENNKMRQPTYYQIVKRDGKQEFKYFQEINSNKNIQRSMFNECNSNCKCNRNKCQNGLINNKQNIKKWKSKIKKTRYTKEIDGKTIKKTMWSLYANEGIDANAHVCEYIGEVITNRVSEIREYFYSINGQSYTFGMHDQEQYDQFENETNQKLNNGFLPLSIDATFFGNESRFINHSCNPNLIAVICRQSNNSKSFHQVHFFATRKILKGEELTFNYQWNKQPVEYIQNNVLCMCKAGNECEKFLQKAKEQSYMAYDIILTDINDFKNEPIEIINKSQQQEFQNIVQSENNNYYNNKKQLLQKQDIIINNQIDKILQNQPIKIDQNQQKLQINSLQNDNFKEFAKKLTDEEIIIIMKDYLKNMVEQLNDKNINKNNLISSLKSIKIGDIIKRDYSYNDPILLVYINSINIYIDNKELLDGNRFRIGDILDLNVFHKNNLSDRYLIYSIFINMDFANINQDLYSQSQNQSTLQPDINIVFEAFPLISKNMFQKYPKAQQAFDFITENIDKQYFMDNSSCISLVERGRQYSGVESRHAQDPDKFIFDERLDFENIVPKLNKIYKNQLLQKQDIDSQQENQSLKDLKTQCLQNNKLTMEGKKQKQVIILYAYNHSNPKEISQVNITKTKNQKYITNISFDQCVISENETQNEIEENETESLQCTENLEQTFPQHLKYDCDQKKLIFDGIDKIDDLYKIQSENSDKSKQDDHIFDDQQNNQIIRINQNISTNENEEQQQNMKQLNIQQLSTTAQFISGDTEMPNESISKRLEKLNKTNVIDDSHNHPSNNGINKQSGIIGKRQQETTIRKSNNNQSKRQRIDKEDQKKKEENENAS